MAADYPQLEPLRVINLREHIESRLRAAILSGAFGPGITSTFAITEFAYFTQFAPVVKLTGYLRQSALVS